jgi:hypothetical protein
VIPHGSLALVPFAAPRRRQRTTARARHTPVVRTCGPSNEHTRDKLRAVIGTRTPHTDRRRSDASCRQRRRTPAGPVKKGGAWRRAFRARPCGCWPEQKRRRRSSSATAARTRFSPLRDARTHRAGQSAGVVAHARRGKRRGRYLRVEEIFNLDLTAELVVLSGCSTGPRRPTGDGIVGLVASLYAGNADGRREPMGCQLNRATAFLMDRFYARCSRDGPRRRRCEWRS